MGVTTPDGDRGRGIIPTHMLQSPISRHFHFEIDLRDDLHQMADVSSW
jgi:hypothetical protein